MSTIKEFDFGHDITKSIRILKIKHTKKEDFNLEVPLMMRAFIGKTIIHDTGKMYKFCYNVKKLRTEEQKESIQNIVEIYRIFRDQGLLYIEYEIGNTHKEAYAHFANGLYSLLCTITEDWNYYY